MENLSAFLNPEQREHVRGVVSDRFQDPEGNPIQWEFRAVSHRESRDILQQNRKNGEVDYQEYQECITAASVVYPDLRNAELQKGLGTMGDEKETLKALLPTMGELAMAIQLSNRANGLATDAAREIKEAKNGSGRA